MEDLEKQNRKEEKKKRKEELKTKPNKKLAIKRLILLVLVILWAIIVFNFSNQDGEESSGLSHLVTTWIFKTEELVEKYEPLVRKLAHFSEYALGGILIYSLINTYNYKFRNKIIISTLLGLWYAILDEIHQTFIPYRSGNAKDVCIDMFGFIFGLLFIIIIFKKFNKTRRKDIERE